MQIAFEFCIMLHIYRCYHIILVEDSLTGVDHMRRTFAILISLVLLISCVCYIAFAANAATFSLSPDNPLRILIIADPQDIDTPQPAMLSLLNASLDAAKPDLVVFLGDMIHGRDLRGEDRVRRAIDAVVSPVASRGFRLHWCSGTMTRNAGFPRKNSLRCISPTRCLTADGEDLPGCGNSYIVVENPVHPDQPAVLWFMDSGSYAEEGKGTYGYVTEEQNAWMLSRYEELCGKYGSPVSYVFQHIPVPQVYNMIREVPFGTSGAVTCYGDNFGKWYVLDEEYIWAGHMGEGPCSSEYDSGEFDAWKQMNVKAAFFGHDHLNDYCGTWDGIDLVTTSGLGFYLYGRGEEHGTRLLELNAEDPAKYKTEMLYYRDLVSKPLPGFFASSLGVMLRKYVLMILAALVLVIVLIVLVIRKIRRIIRKRKWNNLKE